MSCTGRDPVSTTGWVEQPSLPGGKAQWRPAAEVNAKSIAAAMEKNGMGVTRVQGIDTAEFNYAPYAQQMKSENISFVMYYGPFQFTIRLQEAM